MKHFNNKTLLIALIIFSGIGIIASCTHKDEPVPAAVSTGITINHSSHIHLPGSITGDSSHWKFDKQHSSVLWSTAYVGVGAMLTGRFNQFGLADITPAKMLKYSTTVQPLPDTSWAFYENQPAKTYFNGYVQINQSNTGEPGRDAGCNITTMGTTPIEAGTQNLLVTNIAQIKTTSVDFDPISNGYIVKFNFTWKGNLAAPLTQALVGKLTYVPAAVVTTYKEFGLHFVFQINCRDFGITSTNIADKISIEVNTNFNNK